MDIGEFWSLFFCGGHNEWQLVIGCKRKKNTGADFFYKKKWCSQPVKQIEETTWRSEPKTEKKNEDTRKNWKKTSN